MKRLALVAIAATALVAAPSASAQSPVSFGLGGGISLPVGDLKKDFDESGYHVQGMLGFGLPMMPLGLRADIAYHAFNGEVDFGGPAPAEVDQRLFMANLNAVWSMPGVMASPYLLGGVGLYNNKFDVQNFDGDDNSDFGLNIGGGIKLKLAGFSTFVEARYHWINDKDKDVAGDYNSTYLPITVGIMF